MKKLLLSLCLMLSVLQARADGYTCYYFTGKMGDKVSVELVLQQFVDDDEGIVAGRILYPKSGNPSPILVVGHRVKGNWFHLCEYGADGIISGILDFRIGNEDAADGPSILEGQWTDPKTGATYSLTTLHSPDDMVRTQLYVPSWLDCPLEYDGPRSIGSYYSYQQWNPNYQSLMGGHVSFTPAGENRLHFSVSNCPQNIAEGASQSGRPAVLQGAEFEYSNVNECGYGFKATFFREFVVLESTTSYDTFGCFGMGASFDGVYIKIASSGTVSGIADGSRWNIGKLDYTASIYADGSLSFRATDEGEELAFRIIPVADKAGEYGIYQEPDVDGFNPYDNCTRARLMERDGLKLLCLYDSAERLQNILDGSQTEDGETVAINKWVAQLAGDYKTADNVFVTFDEWSTVTLDEGIETPYQHVTFNGNVTGVIDIPMPGAPLTGMNEVVITPGGLSIYTVEQDEYGMTQRTGGKLDLTWAGNESPRFGYAQKVLLNDGRFRRLDKASLRLMRNTILALHGYRFSSADLASYFGSQNWYSPRESNDGISDELSLIETLNIELIKAEEAKPGKE